jgi:hypothetical protein
MCSLLYLWLRVYSSRQNLVLSQTSQGNIKHPSTCSSLFVAFIHYQGTPTQDLVLFLKLPVRLAFAVTLSLLPVKEVKALSLKLSVNESTNSSGNELLSLSMAIGLAW